MLFAPGRCLQLWVDFLGLTTYLFLQNNACSKYLACIGIGSPVCLSRERQSTRTEHITQVSGVGEECWTELYKFTLEPRERDDFRAMCDYHQSSAIMGRRLIISLSSVDGRQATKTTRVFFTFVELLREKFGIVLHSPLTPKDVEIVPPPVTY
uniref:arylamine N-acetyltransferase n=1 Tax=Cyprinus carpio TaxID=7962 RepID=A0A8C2K4L4_CYPCA